MTPVKGSETRASPRAATQTILVVDDERHSREGLRDALVEAGYTVDTAADSWQAIKKVRESPFQVAIIDLDLPPVHGVHMTGWDLVRIFRAYHPAIEIIVVSAESDAALRAQAKRLQVSELLEKPISPNHVKAIVRGFPS